MGVGCPEYVLLFRKPQTDRTRGYADTPVTKSKDDYSRARWQVDAHAFWRSSGNRLSAAKYESMPVAELGKSFREQSRNEVYDYREHVKLGESFDKTGHLPATFMAIAPGSWSDEVWDDVNRIAAQLQIPAGILTGVYFEAMESADNLWKSMQNMEQ